MTTGTTVRIAIGNKSGRAREDRQAIWAQDGLAVTRGFGDDQGRFTITHQASGWAVISGIRTQRDAKAIAARFLAVGDWTRSRTAVTSDSRLKTRAVALRNVLRAENLIPLAR